MKKPRLGLVTRREIKGYVFLLPWLIGFAVFFAVPLVKSVVYSLSDVRLANGIHRTPVGLANFRWVLTENEQFMNEVLGFFGSALLQLAVILVFSLIISMMLNKPLKGKGIFRTLFFLPIVAVSGPVLNRLVSTGNTTVPMIDAYGITAIVSSLLPEAVAAPINNLFSQLILVLWYSGVPILIYMTGLQKISRSIYEAALIDGASAWVVFWKITLPAMRQFIIINAVYTLIFLSSATDNGAYRLIRDGINGISSINWGYGRASAAAWVYCVFLAAVIGVVMLLGREKKANKVEIIKTREQVKAEKLHASRATAKTRRLGGKRNER